LQAVCKDKIFPYIHVFATGYGKADEPRRAYLLANVIALACVCIGKLMSLFDDMFTFMSVFQL
jgi:solute carrier family 12 sodium/potassium/chloride transporter 2